MADLKIMKVLFDQLIREEKRGQRFFKDAATYADDPKVKRLFEHLSVEEEKHLSLLESMWKQITEDPKAYAEASPSTSAEMVEYAGNMQPVFVIDDTPMKNLKLPMFELFKADEFKKLLEQITIRSVLQFAMKLEYDNTKYIVGFMKHIKNKRSLTILKKMADEEKGHFIALKRIYDGLAPGIK